jgi:hypothetical protein
MVGDLFVHVGSFICRQSWYELIMFDYKAALNASNPMMITVRHPSLNVKAIFHKIFKAVID